MHQQTAGFEHCLRSTPSNATLGSTAETSPATQPPPCVGGGLRHPPGKPSTPSATTGRGSQVSPVIPFPGVMQLARVCRMGLQAERFARELRTQSLTLRKTIHGMCYACARNSSPGVPRHRRGSLRRQARHECPRWNASACGVLCRRGRRGSLCQAARNHGARTRAPKICAWGTRAGTLSSWPHRAMLL